MAKMKMHIDEVHTDVPLVRRLIATQFPQWADRQISPVASSGTDNALYRLGKSLVARLPRIHWAVGQIDKEIAWLPLLAPHLPLDIPFPLVKGHPQEGYPYDWGIYRWLEGENVTIEQLADPVQTAIDLAHFLNALQQIDTAGCPGPGQHSMSRGRPLAYRNSATRKAIAALDGMIDARSTHAAWDAALDVPEWNREPVWFHGDMLPGNLLFTKGRLSGVIDFGELAVGDPACDLMIAWHLFTGESREMFRAALGVDDTTWARGRAWALSQALIFISYYLDTNPAGVESAWQAVANVLAEHTTSG